MSRYKRNQADATRKLNAAFDDLFAGMKGAPKIDATKSAREAFGDFLGGNKRSKPAGGSPAIKKDLDPIDRKILGLKNIIEDPGASEGEKASARKILARLEAKKAGR